MGWGYFCIKLFVFIFLLKPFSESMRGVRAIWAVLVVGSLLMCFAPRTSGLTKAFQSIENIDTGLFPSHVETIPGRPVLQIGGLFPLTTTDRDPERLSAAKAAVMMINNSTEYDFTLQLLYSDTMRSPSVTVNVAIPMLLNEASSPGPVFAIVGPSSSAEAKALAPVLSSFGAFCVSYSATSPDLSEVTAYPYFMRTVPSDEGAGLALASLIEHLNWKRVTVLSSNDDYGNGISSQLVSNLQGKRIAVTLWAKFSILSSDPDEIEENIENALVDLCEADARIIILNCLGSYGRTVLLKARDLNMFGTRVQWVLSDGLTSDRFLSSWENNKIDYELYNIVRGAIGIRPSIANPEHHTGHTSQDMHLQTQFLQLWKSLDSNDFPGAGWNIAGLFSYFAVDAVFTLAKAAQALLDSGKYTVDTLPMSAYDPFLTSKETYEVMNRTLTGLEFEGITGPVKFDGKGDRVSTFQAVNLQHPTKFTIVGSFNIDHEISNFSKNTLLFYGNSSTIVNDGTIHWEEYAWSEALRIAVLSIVALSMIATVVVAYFVHRCRRVRVIKAGSVKFMHLVCLGVFICYGSLIVTYFSANEVVCTTYTDLQHIGFYLAFGAVFLKTFRLRMLLRNRSQVSCRLTDGRLLTVLGILMVCVILYCLVFSIILPINSEEVVYSQRSETNANVALESENEIDIYTFYRACEMSWWSFSLYIVSLIFLVVCGYMAFTIKDTPISFKEGKYIGMAVYNWGFIRIVVGFILTFTDLNPDIWFSLTAFQTWFTSTALLFLLFGPKFYLIKSGKGDCSSSSFSGLNIVKHGRRTASEVPKAKYQNLLEHFTSLKKANETLVKALEVCECSVNCDVLANLEMPTDFESNEYSVSHDISPLETEGILATVHKGSSLHSTDSNSKKPSPASTQNENQFESFSSSEINGRSNSSVGLKLPDIDSEKPDKKPDGDG